MGTTFLVRSIIPTLARSTRWRIDSGSSSSSPAGATYAGYKNVKEKEVEEAVSEKWKLLTFASYLLARGTSLAAFSLPPKLLWECLAPQKQTIKAETGKKREEKNNIKKKKKQSVHSC